MEKTEKLFKLKKSRNESKAVPEKKTDTKEKVEENEETLKETG